MAGLYVYLHRSFQGWLPILPNKRRRSVASTEQDEHHDSAFLLRSCFESAARPCVPHDTFGDSACKVPIPETGARQSRGNIDPAVIGRRVLAEKNSGRRFLKISAYGLLCRVGRPSPACSGFQQVVRGRRGDHGRGLPPYKLSGTGRFRPACRNNGALAIYSLFATRPAFPSVYWRHVCAAGSQ